MNNAMWENIAKKGAGLGWRLGLLVRGDSEDESRLSESSGDSVWVNVGSWATIL